ncbi:hypothetical protein ACQKKK_15275 [Peribacillus sp. NPDC006672]
MIADFNKAGAKEAAENIKKQGGGSGWSNLGCWTSSFYLGSSRLYN